MLALKGYTHRKIPGVQIGRWGSDDQRLAGTVPAFGNYRFVCWAIVADLQYLCDDLGFPHHGSHQFCWLCSASRSAGSETPFTDLSRTANWRSTILSDDEAIAVPATTHPISLLRGTTRFHAAGDLMHTGDLGVLCWFWGSVLWELVYDGPFAGNVDRRLEQVSAVIKSIYDEQGTPDRMAPLRRNHFDHEGLFLACG